MVRISLMTVYRIYMSQRNSQHHVTWHDRQPDGFCSRRHGRASSSSHTQPARSSGTPVLAVCPCMPAMPHICRKIVSGLQLLHAEPCSPWRSCRAPYLELELDTGLQRGPLAASAVPGQGQRRQAVRQAAGAVDVHDQGGLQMQATKPLSRVISTRKAVAQEPANRALWLHEWNLTWFRA